MGDKIPIDARESWSEFVRSRAKEFTFKYEWIKDSRFYSWVHENTDKVDLYDRNNTCTVFIHSE